MALRARLPSLMSSSRILYARCFSGPTDTSGAIRDAGGSFGKKEKAIEDQYFRKLEAAQVRKLQEEKAQHHEEEIDSHKDAIRDLEDQIKRHKEKIRRHKRKLDDVEDTDSD